MASRKSFKEKYQRVGNALNNLQDFNNINYLSDELNRVANESNNSDKDRQFAQTIANLLQKLNTAIDGLEDTDKDKIKDVSSDPMRGFLNSLNTVMGQEISDKNDSYPSFSELQDAINKFGNNITNDDFINAIKDIASALSSLSQINIFDSINKQELEFTNVGLNAINQQLKLVNELSEENKGLNKSTQRLYEALGAKNIFSEKIDELHQRLYQIQHGDNLISKEFMLRDVKDMSFDEIMSFAEHIDLTRFNRIAQSATDMVPEFREISLNNSISFFSDVEKLQTCQIAVLQTWLKNTTAVGVLTDEQEQQLKDVINNKIQDLQNNTSAISQAMSTTIQNRIDSTMKSAESRQSTTLSKLANGRNLTRNITDSVKSAGTRSAQLWQQIATSKYTMQTSYNPLKLLSQPWLNSSLKNMQQQAERISRMQVQFNTMGNNIADLQHQADKAYKEGREDDAERLTKRIQEQIDSLSMINTQLNKAAALIGQEWNNLSESDRKRLSKNSDGLESKIKGIMENAKKSANYSTALRAAYNMKSDSDELNALKDVNSALKDLKKEAKETGKKSEESKSSAANFLKSVTDGISGFFGSIQRLVNGLGLGDFILGPVSLSAKAHEFYRQQGQERYSSMGAAALVGADNLELEAERAQSRMMMGNQLYMQSGGLIDQMAVQKSYRSMLQVGGQVGQSAEKTTEDMDFLSRQTALMQNVYGIEQSTINDVVKTYYQGMRLSASEAAQSFYRLTQTAQSANVPIDQYLKAVSELANKYMSIGIAGEQAENVLDSLMERHIRIDIAKEVAAQLGQAMQKFAEDDNKVGFAAAMQGEDPFVAMSKAARTHDEHGDPRAGWFSDVIGYMSTDMKYKMMPYGNDPDLKFMGMTKLLKEYGFDGRASSMLASIAEEKGMNSVDFKEMFEKESKKLDNPNATLEEKNQQISDQLSAMANQLAMTDRLQAMSRGRLFQEASTIGKGIDELANAIAPVLLAFQQTMIELTVKAVQAISDFVSGDLFEEVKNHIIDALKWLPVALSGIFVFFFGKKLLGLVFTLLGGAGKAIAALFKGAKKFGPAALKFAKGAFKNPLVYAGLTLLTEVAMPMFSDKFEALGDMIEGKDGKSLKDLLPSFPDKIEWKNRPKFDLDNPDDHPLMKKYQETFTAFDKILSGDLSGVSSKESQEQLLADLKKIREDQWKDGSLRPEYLNKLDEVEKKIKDLQDAAKPSYWDQAKSTAQDVRTALGDTADTIAGAYYPLGELHSDGSAAGQVTDYLFNNASSFAQLALGPSTASASTLQGKQSTLNQPNQTDQIVSSSAAKQTTAQMAQTVPSTTTPTATTSTRPIQGYYDPYQHDAADTMRRVNPDIADAFENGSYTSRVDHGYTSPVESTSPSPTRAIDNADTTRQIVTNLAQGSPIKDEINAGQDNDSDTEVFGEQFNDDIPEDNMEAATTTVQQFNSSDTPTPQPETNPVEEIARTIQEKDEIQVQYDDNELPILAQITNARNRKLREELQDLYEQRNDVKKQLADEQEHMRSLQEYQRQLSAVISDSNTSQTDREEALRQSRNNQTEMQQTAELIGKLVTQENQNFSDIKSKKDTLERSIKNDLYEQAHNTRSNVNDEDKQTQTKHEETSHSVEDKTGQAGKEAADTQNQVTTNIQDTTNEVQGQNTQQSGTILDGVKDILSSILGVKTDNDKKDKDTNANDKSANDESTTDNTEDDKQDASFSTANRGFKETLSQTDRDKIAEQQRRDFMSGKSDRMATRSGHILKESAPLTYGGPRVITDVTAQQNGMKDLAKQWEDFKKSWGGSTKEYSTTEAPTAYDSSDDTGNRQGIGVLFNELGNVFSRIRKSVGEHTSKTPTFTYQSASLGNVDPNSIQEANKNAMSIWRWLHDKSTIGQGKSITDSVEDPEGSAEKPLDEEVPKPYDILDDTGDRESISTVTGEIGDVWDKKVQENEAAAEKRRKEWEAEQKQIAEAKAKAQLELEAKREQDRIAGEEARKRREEFYDNVINGVMNLPTTISNFIDEYHKAQDDAKKTIAEINDAMSKTNDVSEQTQEMLGTRIANFLNTPPEYKPNSGTLKKTSSDSDDKLGHISYTIVPDESEEKEEKKEETPSLSAEEVNKQIAQGQGHVEMRGGYAVWVAEPPPETKKQEKSNLTYNGYNYVYTGEKLREEIEIEKQRQEEERKRKEAEAYRREIQEFTDRMNQEDELSRKQLAELAMPVNEQNRINALFDDSKWSSDVDLNTSDNDKAESGSSAPLSREGAGQTVINKVTNEQKKEQLLSKITNTQLQGLAERHQLLMQLFQRSVKYEHGELWYQIKISHKILTDIINTAANGFAYITEAAKARGSGTGGGGTGGTFNLSDSGNVQSGNGWADYDLNILSNVTAESIDDLFATNEGSVLAGKGAKIIELGKKYNIDPGMASVIMAYETGYGTSSLAKNQFNFGGIGGAGHESTFSSVDEGIEAVFKILAKYRDEGNPVDGKKIHTLGDILRYWWKGKADVDVTPYINDIAPIAKRAGLTEPTNSGGTANVNIIEPDYWQGSWINVNEPSIGTPNKITIHHTANTNDTVESIDRYHREHNGWSGIGYHFVVYPDGTVHRGRNIGTQGAHAENHNENNIGIAMVGNFEHGSKPSKAQEEALKRLLNDLSKIYDLPLDWHKTIFQHKDLNHGETGCAGDVDWETIVNNAGTSPVKQVAYRITNMLKEDEAISQGKPLNSDITFTDEQQNQWNEVYDKLNERYQDQFLKRLIPLYKDLSADGAPITTQDVKQYLADGLKPPEYNEMFKHFQDELSLLASQQLGYNINNPEGLTNLQQLQSLVDQPNIFNAPKDLMQHNDKDFIEKLSPQDTQMTLNNILQDEKAKQVEGQSNTTNNSDEAVEMLLDVLSRLNFDNANKYIQGGTSTNPTSSNVRVMNTATYSGEVSGETGSWYNCGPTSIATMLTASGINKKPSEILRYMTDNNIVVAPDNMQGVMKTFGLDTQFVRSAGTDKADTIAQALQSGHAVMFAWGPEANYGAGAYGSAKKTESGYTSSGHYTTALGITSDGYVMMSDPGRGNEEHYQKSKLTLKELLKFAPDIWIAGKQMSVSADVDNSSTGSPTTSSVSTGNLSQDAARTAALIKGDADKIDGLYARMGISPDMWSQTQINSTGHLDQSVLESNENDKATNPEETEEQRKEREQAEQERIKNNHASNRSKTGVKYRTKDIDIVLEEHPEWNRYQNKEEIYTELDKKPEYGLDDDKLLQYYGLSIQTPKDMKEADVKAIKNQVATNIRNDLAPNGSRISDNDILYLVNNGYTIESAKAALFNSEKYKPKISLLNTPTREPIKAVVSGRGNRVNTVVDDEIFMGEINIPYYGETPEYVKTIVADNKITPLVTQNNKPNKPATASAVYSSAESLQKLNALRSRLAGQNKLTVDENKKARSYSDTTKLSKEEKDSISKRVIDLNIPWDMGRKEIDALVDSIKAIVSDGLVEPKEKENLEQLLLDLNVSASNINKIMALVHKEKVDAKSVS